MTRRQKIIIILAVVLVAAGAVFYFAYPQPETGTVPESSPRTGFLPETINRILNRGGSGKPQGSVQPTPVSAADRQKQKLYRISHEPALAPMLTSDGAHVQYFTRKEGILWQSDLEGLGQQRLDDKPILNLVEVVWSPKGNEAILTIADPSDAPRKYFYNVSAKKSQTLDRYMRSVAFSPAGNRIIYHYLNTANGNSTIATAIPNGSDFKAIYQPLFNDFTLLWPKEDGAAIQSKPSYFAETALYSLDTRVGTISKVVPKSNPGLSAIWSGDGNRYLATRVTDSGVLEHAVSGMFRQSEPKNLFSLKTLAEKCVWKLDRISVICGVPSEIPFDVKLPDDYYNGVFISADDVLEVNTESGATRSIGRSQDLYPVMDIDSPIIAADQSRIFFLNRRDGYIYALRITQ